MGSFCDPNCKECGGIGYVRYGAPFGDPNFGKVHLCPQRSVAVTQSVSALTEPEMELDWSAVKDWGDTKHAVRIVRTVLARGYGWVYLYGSNSDNPDGYGIGKSLILKIAIAEALRMGVQAVYQNMSGILDYLRAAYDDEGSSAVKRLEHFGKVPVLAIDEVEKINKTPWASERMPRLFDMRYTTAVRQESSVLLVAGNKDPRTMDGYLWSRFSDNRFLVNGDSPVITMNNKDMRPAVKPDQLF